MNPGCVLFHRGFEFENGEKADKLLVVLNHQKAGRFLVLLTTSRPRKTRPRDEGCQAERGYYFVSANRHWFNSDTWILLYRPYEIEAHRLRDSEERGDVRIMATLETDFARAIINCFKRCDDCSEHHLYMLK